MRKVYEWKYERRGTGEKAQASNKEGKESKAKEKKTRKTAKTGFKTVMIIRRLDSWLEWKQKMIKEWFIKIRK